MRIQTYRCAEFLLTRSRIFGMAVAFVLGLGVFWLFSGSANVTAQGVPSRIAVIDVQKVLSRSNAGKAASAKIKQIQDSRIARAKVMQDEMKTLENTLATGRARLAPARVRDLESQITEKQLAMKRFAEDAEKEYTTTRDRELQALETRVKPIVDAMGKEMGLAAIFNKFESGLVFASDAIDITETLIVRFNAAAPATQTTPLRN